MRPSHFSSVRISHQRLLGYYEGFLKELRKSKPETRGTYERSLHEFLRWYPSDQKFQFRVEDVERYKMHLTKKLKLSPVSVSTYLTALRRLFDYLVGMKVLERNPAKEVKGNKRPQQHSRETISMQDVQAIFQSIERVDERGFRDFAVIKAMVGCGLSEIELIRANIGDLKTVSSTMVFYVQGKGKTTKETSVILPNDVKEAFQGYLAFRKDADDNEPLFMSAGNRTRGKRMTTRGIRQRVNSYLVKSGVKSGKSRRITAFSLRHTAATIMAQNGATVEELQSKFRIGTAGTAMIYIKKTVDSGE
ncbi:MAG TPA: tyrosine-type recombinase/integrase [Bacteroidota bacterium]|nr:tyrosine-type recombinase/integrase [Bacteroidota bacterium]